MPKSSSRRHSTLTGACLVFSIMLLTLASSAWAGDITYNIVNYPDNQADQNGGIDGVSGTITTDGNLGTLTQSDILSYNWTIGYSTGTYTNSFPAGGGGLSASGLLATSSQLLLPQGGLLSMYPYEEPSSLFYSNTPMGAYSGNVGGLAFFGPTPPSTAPGSIAAIDPWIIGVTGNGTSAAPYQATTVSGTGNVTTITAAQANSEYICEFGQAFGIQFTTTGFPEAGV